MSFVFVLWHVSCRGGFRILCSYSSTPRANDQMLQGCDVIFLPSPNSKPTIDKIETQFTYTRTRTNSSNTFHVFILHNTTNRFHTDAVHTLIIYLTHPTHPQPPTIHTTIYTHQTPKCKSIPPTSKNPEKEKKTRYPSINPKWNKTPPICNAPPGVFEFDGTANYARKLWVKTKNKRKWCFPQWWGELSKMESRWRNSLSKGMRQLWKS